MIVMVVVVVVVIIIVVFIFFVVPWHLEKKGKKKREELADTTEIFLRCNEEKCYECPFPFPFDVRVSDIVFLFVDR